MSNHRDEIDSWLDADVQPLTPPPGTFERVSRRARRRKAGRAIASAAGAMVVVAGLAIAPRVAGTLLHQPASRRPGGRAVAARRWRRIAPRWLGHPITARPGTGSARRSPVGRPDRRA